jgi:tetratricopeptide (TPR) repeat protein
MLKRGVYLLGVCAICLFIISIPLFAEDIAIPQPVLDLQQAAKLCTENKDFNLAQENYQAIILNFPKTDYAMDAQSEIGVLYVKTGQIDKADAVLDTLSTIYKDNPGVVFAAQKVILACEEKKDYNTALMFCQKLLGQYGANPEAIRIKGWLAGNYIRLNQTEEADAVIQKMLEEGSEQEYSFGSIIFHVGNAYSHYLKQPQKTIAVYHDFLNRYPGNPHSILTHRKLVDIYFRSGQADIAVQETDSFLTRYAGQERLLSLSAGIADLLYNCKAYDKSIEFCKFGLTKLSGTEKGSSLRIILIRNYLKKGDNAAAEAELKTYFDQYSASPFCVDKGLVISRAFTEARRYETAAGICEKLLTMFPNHEKAIDVLRALWVNCQQTGQVGDLGGVAKTLLAQYEDSAESKYLEVAVTCSEIHLQGKDYFGALDVSKTALRKYPFSAKSAYLLAVEACACLNLSDLSQAKAIVDTLQMDYRYSAGFGKAMNKVGHCCRKLGDYAEAIALYQLVLDTKSDPVTEQLYAIRGIGQCYARQGEDQKVLQIGDTMASVYKGEKELAISLFVLGEEFCIMAQEAQKNRDPNAARINYEKAITVLENNISKTEYTRERCLFYYGIGLSCRELGDFAKAADAFYVAIEADPGFIYAGSMHWLIADCYEKLKRDGIVDAVEADPAIEWGYQTLFDAYPDSRDVAYAAIRLGEINLARGKPVAACVYFNWFMDYVHAGSGQFPDIYRILARLKECGQ